MLHNFLRASLCQVIHFVADDDIVDLHSNQEWLRTLAWIFTSSSTSLTTFGRL
jgi:hypothetical protein